MVGLTLIQQARLAGFTVWAEGGTLRLKGPRQREPLARELMAQKPQVMAELARERTRRRPPVGWVPITPELFKVRTIDDLLSLPDSEQPPEPCFNCGCARWWQLRRGGRWRCGTCCPPNVDDGLIRWLP